jgi:hypothetical protein
MATIFNTTMDNVRNVFETMCRDVIADKLRGKRVFEFDTFTNMDENFNKAFFDGGSSWIEGGMTKRQAQQKMLSDPLPADEVVFYGNALRLERIRDNIANKSPLSWPTLSNFQCRANSVMCCYADYDTAVSSSNTDVCFVDYSRATHSHHIRGGLGLFPDDQEGVYCHGFAWGEGSIEEELKGNLLFMGDVYVNVLKRGMKRNVVGEEMDVCVIRLC